MRFSVYGRIVEVSRVQNGWEVFYVGNEGKRRPAEELVIPAHLSEEELTRYLADLCHEWAVVDCKDVKRID
jgi:hypothetical protein